MADAQLKALVQEWEAVLDSQKARAEDRVAEELDPMAYPQVCVSVSVCQTEWRVCVCAVLVLLFY